MESSLAWRSSTTWRSHRTDLTSCTRPAPARPGSYSCGRSISWTGHVALAASTGRINPFFSPDGAWVGFATERDRSWKKVSILGGPFVTLWDSPTPPRGASWGPDDTIIFAQSASGTGLFRGPAAGGEPEILTTPDEEQGETVHLWPEILPGGRAVLFTVLTGATARRTIAVLDLETNKRRTLVPGGSNPRYAPTGHILYGAGGVLFAVPFDLDRLAVTGDPVPVLEDVMMSLAGAVNFALSGERVARLRHGHRRRCWRPAHAGLGGSCRYGAACGGGAQEISGVHAVARRHARGCTRAQ